MYDKYNVRLHRDMPDCYKGRLEHFFYVPPHIWNDETPQVLNPKAYPIVCGFATEVRAWEVIKKDSSNPSTDEMMTLKIETPVRVSRC